MNETLNLNGASCPMPLRDGPRIVMGHGSGGKMMMDLINEVFVPPVENPILARGNDAGVVAPYPGGRLAVSTDSHVVTPLFFPGGDIGKLAVCGTVNDVAMMGATPQYLTVGFILEEGLEIQILGNVMRSMRAAAEEAGVLIVAGDTKVVQSGKADGLYINSAGIGTIRTDVEISGDLARPGDVVILSGCVGNHGIAVLGARGELGFETNLESDCAPLNHMIEKILDVAPGVRVLRDPTRGGLATSLNEIARQSKVGILLREDTIPVEPAVSAACEMLGFDPLYIANEGKLIAIVPSEDSEIALEAMRADQYGTQAVIIGEVIDSPHNRVLMKTGFGSTRVVDILMDEMLPRIC